MDPRLQRVTLALCVIAIVLAMALVLTFGHGRDQSIYALVARETLDGGMPYRDAFDFKPPGIFVVYAIARALFGAGPVAIRILEVVAMAASVAALVRIGRRELGSTLVGWVAAALACGLHAQLDFWHTGQPESFGEPLGLWAIALAASAGREPAARRRAGLLVAAGALLGVAGLMKPPLAGAGPVVAALAAWLRDQGRDADWSTKARARQAVVPFLWVALGGGLPIVLCLAWFAARGALGDLHEVLFVFTPQYTRISWKDVAATSMLWRGLIEWLTVYSSALLGGLVLAAAMPWPARGRPVLAAALAMCLVHVAGVAMQAKFFPYHWGATFAPTALLAATGWVALLTAASRRHVVIGAGALALALAVASVHAPVPNMGQALLDRAARRIEVLTSPPGAQRTADLDALASIADVDGRHNRAAAAMVAEHVPPGQPIFVWGFEPAVYDLADRPVASRFIYDVPQRAAWSKGPMRAALMRDLAARPPVAIVVEHNDVFPFVTGDSLDSAASLEDFTELEELLATRYRMVGRAGDLDVWVLSNPAPG